MSLRTKLLSITAVPVVLLLLLVGLGRWADQRTTQTLQAVERTHQVEVHVQAVLNDLVDAETGVRGFVLTGRTEFLEPYYRGSGAVGGDLNELAALVQEDPVQADRADQLKLLTVQRLNAFTDLMRYAPVTGRSDTNQLIGALRGGKNIMDAERVIIAQMLSREDAILQQRERSLEDARRTASLISIGFQPVAVILGLLMILIFVRRLAARIAGIEENARRLEAGEPLQDPPAGRDEVDQLAREFVRTGTRVIELQGELRALAIVDPLTQLMNRRGFEPLATHRLTLASRSEDPLALLFVDIDNLKPVNDQLGHSAGDALIMETADVLRSTFRESDLVARVGGDEFCVLLSTKEDASPDVAVRRFLAEVAERNREPDRAYDLSVSLGMEVFDAEHPLPLETLMERADEKMYAHKRAKRAGTPLAAAAR